MMDGYNNTSTRTNNIPMLLRKLVILLEVFYSTCIPEPPSINRGVGCYLSNMYHETIKTGIRVE
jgi:hypothetical protein